LFEKHRCPKRETGGQKKDTRRADFKDERGEKELPNQPEKTLPNGGKVKFFGWIQGAEQGTL